VSNRKRLRREKMCPCGQHPASESHPYGEAFMLMWYRSDDGAEEHRIWNARNGVTPLMVTFPDSRRQGKHHNWASDVYAPNWEPEPGDLVFAGPPDKPRLIKWPLGHLPAGPDRFA
jgi:hypothetical protein